MLALLGDVSPPPTNPTRPFDAYTKFLQGEGANARRRGAQLLACSRRQKSSRKRGDWDKVDAMFEEFIKEHPDHPSGCAGGVLDWPREGQAWQADEAKQYIAGWSRSTSTTRNARRRRAVARVNWRRCACGRNRRRPPVPPPKLLPAASPACRFAAERIAAAQRRRRPEADPEATPARNSTSLLGSVGEGPLADRPGARPLRQVAA